MPVWISLIRGINVGGRNILPMRELVRDLESIGLEDVSTYIQSGNVIFRSPGRSARALGRKITAAIASDHDFEPYVLVLRADELKEVIDSVPFAEAESEPRTVHCLFLGTAPKSPDVEAMERARCPSERYELTERALYFHAPDGIGRSKFAASVERHLGVAVTGRNWRTVLKLSAMVESAESG